MKKKPQNRLKLAYSSVAGGSREEVQRRMDKAFDILFDEVVAKNSEDV